MGQRFDPYDILGVPRRATEDAIKAAYRKKAKQYHPDLNLSGSNDEFIRVQAAFEWFERQNFRPNPNADGPSFDPARSAFAGAGDEAPNWEADVIALVRTYMREHGLAVQFDGTFVRTDALQMAHAPGDIDRVLGLPELDEEALVDEIVIDVRKRGTIAIAPGWAVVLGSKINRGLIQVAVRVIKRHDQRQRLVTVMRPLLMPLSSSEQRQAEAQWRRLVETTFAMSTDLGVAVLKKFIHQVKSKRLKRPIKHHLMPIFQSEVQGGGKTTAALKFLSPLKELRTEPALLSDFADKRSGDVYRYPVVFLDDIDQISPNLIPILNSLVTGDGLQRRTLGSSGSRRIKQLSTLIGTSNKPIADLIPDET